MNRYLTTLALALAAALTTIVTAAPSCEQVASATPAVPAVHGAV